VSEVNNKLEWLVVERLECQKNVVDQEITIHIQNPITRNEQIMSTTYNTSLYMWRAQWTNTI